MRSLPRPPLRERVTSWVGGVLENKLVMALLGGCGCLTIIPAVMLYHRLTWKWQRGTLSLWCRHHFTHSHPTAPEADYLTCRRCHGLISLAEAHRQSARWKRRYLHAPTP